jgi:hypothetical protein
MMKLLSAFILVLFLLAGCTTGKINFQKDEFKGTTVVTMELHHGSDELLYYTWAEAIYARELGPKGDVPTTVNFTFHAEVTASDLEKKAYLKIDEKKYDLQLTDISGRVITEITTSKTKTYEADSTGFVDFTQTPKTDTDVSSNSHKVYSAKLPLNTEIEKNILSAGKIILRVYFGTSARTFTIANKDLEKIKKFITAKPENKK